MLGRVEAQGSLLETGWVRRHLVAAGVLKGKLTAIIDSSPVHGAGAVADTYALIAGFLAKIVRAGGDTLNDDIVSMAAPFCGPKRAGHQGPAAAAVEGGTQDRSPKKTRPPKRTLSQIKSHEHCHQHQAQHGHSTAEAILTAK